MQFCQKKKNKKKKKKKKKKKNKKQKKKKKKKKKKKNKKKAKKKKKKTKIVTVDISNVLNRDAKGPAPLRPTMWSSGPAMRVAPSPPCSQAAGRG